MPNVTITAAKKDRFEALFRLASALAWSDSDRMYDGLGRILLEHVMMTSVASSLSPSDGNSGREIKARALSTLEAARSSAGVRFTTLRDLVEFYVDALFASQEPIAVTSDGDHCSWVLGCPAAARPYLVGPPGIRAFCVLENDHVYPRARTM